MLVVLPIQLTVTIMMNVPMIPVILLMDANMLLLNAMIMMPVLITFVIPLVVVITPSFPAMMTINVPQTAVIRLMVANIRK
jgi:hypothetical protein